MEEYGTFSQSFGEKTINLLSENNNIIKKSTGVRILGIESIVPPKKYQNVTTLQILDSEIRQLQILEAEITKSIIMDMYNTMEQVPANDVTAQNTIESISISAKDIQPQTVDEQIVEKSATEQQTTENQTEIQIAAVEQSTNLLITQKECKDLLMSCEPVTEEKSQKTNLLQISELQSTELVTVEVQSSEQISTKIDYFEESVIQTTEIKSMEKQTSECSFSNTQVIKKQKLEKKTSNRKAKCKNNTDLEITEPKITKTQKNTQTVRQVTQSQTITKLPIVYLTRYDINTMKNDCTKEEKSTDNQSTQEKDTSGQMISESGVQQVKECVNLERSTSTKCPNCVVLLQRIYMKK